MTDHEGTGHGEVDLTLASRLPDGGRMYQSWTVCECTAAYLRSKLGEPQNETVATAEQTRTVAEQVLKHGGVHLLSGGL